jgi:2-polyprenyl-3-methyl-5-hydroxy-6-metoxy-1,4-benzoquinol methylase
MSIRQYLGKKLKKTFYFFFPNWVEILKRELEGCQSVLDLGCGNNSFVRFCNIPFTVGVDIHEPYIKESQAKGYHTQYIHSDVRTVALEPKSFDAVVSLAVIEHMTKEDAVAYIRKISMAARKKIILSTPNGFIEHDAIDNNLHQLHLCGFSVAELEAMGFKVYGTMGWKPLRGIAGRPKLKPAIFSEVLSGITQYWVYRRPKYSFVLLAVKNLDQEK